jgi:transketolase
MALAEKLLAAQFNRPGFDIVDHRTWVFLGDGCLMEGVSHEVASLAGTLGLSKLICFYDDNGISIDGHVSGWFRDDTPKRFEAYGWRVIRDVDGHDPVALHAAVSTALTPARGPTLICCKTIIGKGSPGKAGQHEVHGAPLGDAEVAATRAALGWTHAPFDIPSCIRKLWDGRARGRALEDAWRERLEAYALAHPTLAAEFERRMRGELPLDWPAKLATMIERFGTAKNSVATRKASQNVIEALAAALPELVGGSADLTWSNLTAWPASRAVGEPDGGNYLHYGVREFGMAAIMNGLALHGGFIPFGGTFLVFSDYARNALRMAALMKLRSIFVLTHDSVGLGEDGPTHQPIEHAVSLRCIPNLDVWRPCDALETAVAWAAAVEGRDGPTCLLLSRQSLPSQQRGAQGTKDVRRGGYVLREPASGRPQAVILATGSEVQLAVKAQEQLGQQGIPVRVVSMPCTSAFDRQDAQYRASVLPPGLPRVSVEAGVTGFWRQYVGLEGETVGIDRFGESAPAAALYDYFGLTADKVAAAVKLAVARQAGLASAAERTTQAIAV